MTLILNHASPVFTLQVTDRLVTQGGNQFDPLANKNLLYCARNGLVAIAYTGFAFLGEVPTDQWIAEQLTGISFQQQGLPTIRLGRLKNWMDIGLSMRLLRGRLESVALTHVPKVWQQQWQAQSFDLCVTGWQWSRRRARPIIEWLSKPPGRFDIVAGRKPRYWFWENKLDPEGRRMFRHSTSAAPGENISAEDLQQLMMSAQGRSPDEVESLFAEFIRRASIRTPEIGPHCMSIIVGPPAFRKARIKFIPAAPHEAVLHNDLFSRRLSVAYSPWLIGPNVIQAPAIRSGSGVSISSLGPYQVRLEGPTDDSGLTIQFTQGRPNAPKP